VYVENTVRAVYVNNINVPGGQKITIPSDPVRPEPIQPQDRRNLGRDLAFRGGTGVAAAAPEPTQAGDRPEEQLRGTTQLTANAGLVPPDSLLSDVSLPTQSLGDSMLAGGGSGGGANTALYAYSGTGITPFPTLNLGFTVDLGSGAITNGYMNGTGSTMGVFNLYGGTGYAGTLNTSGITGFSGTTHGTNTGIYSSAPLTPGDPSVNIVSILLRDPPNTGGDLYSGSITVLKQ
jgi:hypothetical protein